MTGAGGFGTVLIKKKNVRSTPKEVSFQQYYIVVFIDSVLYSFIMKRNVRRVHNRTSAAMHKKNIKKKWWFWYFRKRLLLVIILKLKTYAIPCFLPVVSTQSRKYV